jgi:hypothetical protein
MGGASASPVFLKGVNIMKIFVDKGNGFKMTGKIDKPETIQQIKSEFTDYQDAYGDLFFSEKDLNAYYNGLKPFLKNLSKTN